MRDGVALVAILARVRRRLRAMAAIEGAVGGAALALAALAVGLAVARWRGGGLPVHRIGFAIAVTAAAAGAGALAGALRRVSLERCARIVDRTLDSHDRVLSALTFSRAVAGERTTPFMAAAIADAVARAATVAPRAAAPFRRPRAAPALAAAAFLLAAGALSPLPAQGSRAPAASVGGASSAKSAAAARVRLTGHALDPERELAAAALRAATALGDPQLDALARALAATVAELSDHGLDQGQALDRLSELLRRTEQAADEVAGLPQALEQAGGALRATPATRDSGSALAAGDGAATERSLSALADRAAQAGDGERHRIAGSLDRAGAALDRLAAESPPPSPAGDAPGEAAARNGDGAMVASASDTPAGDAAASAEERHRRLARDDPHGARAPGSSSAAAGGPRERRLQRLQRELKETASACRADPEACRRKLQRQAHELPRMENEARSLSERQRLAEAVRQLRERLRREGGGAGERAREERRFMRSARGETGAPGAGRDGEPGGEARVVAEDADGVSQEGDGDGDDSDGDSDGDGDGDGQSGALAETSREQAGDGRAQSAGGADKSGAGQGPAGEQGGYGDGIGNQKGDDRTGEGGPLGTRGRTREAAVKDGAGPNRSQVIQSAARRGFAHTTYQNVYADYQAVVEESLDGSAVPPGRRYIVRRYFQLIRPQSPRAPR